MSCKSCHKNPCSCSSNNASCENILTEDVKYNGNDFICEDDSELSLSSGLTLSSIVFLIYNKLCSLKNSITTITTDVSNFLQGHTIQHNEVDKTQRLNLNFKGNVNVTDDSVNNTTVVEILPGVSGNQGEQGFSFLSGVGIPAPSLGRDSELYVDLSSLNLDLYKKDNGVWVDTGLDIKGLQGVSGVNGTNGTNGINGVNGLNIYQGDGVPLVGSGFNGESYIDSLTGDLYRKTSGNWVVTGNIYTGATIGSSNFFNVEKQVDTVIEEIANALDEEFGISVGSGRYNYGLTWLTDVQVITKILNNVQYKGILIVEDIVTDGIGENISAILVINNVSVETKVILNTKPTTLGNIFNILFELSPISLNIGDTVSLRIVAPTNGNPMQFRKLKAGSIFYNSQL